MMIDLDRGFLARRGNEDHCIWRAGAGTCLVRCGVGLPGTILLI